MTDDSFHIKIAPSPVVLILLCLLLPAVASAAFPRPTGFVNDFAGVIGNEAKDGMEKLLSSFERATGIEVAVVTLPSLEGRTVEDVAVELYKRWGIGKRGKDDGVLFLVAPNERRMRIEVGYGLEGAINDALAGRLLDENVVPRFRAGDLSQGIAAGTSAIVRTIVDKEGLSFDAGAAAGIEEANITAVKKKGGPLSVALKVLFFIFMAYMFIRHPWLFLFLLASSGRGGGRSGFSGGFGGFGGGMSGGGGASRSW